MPLPHLPILRNGSIYESLDKVELADLRTGVPAAVVSQANAGILRRDLARMAEAREALRQLSTRQLLDFCAKAGELFLNSELPFDGSEGLQSPDQYIRQVSSTTGLPHPLCRQNMQKIHQVFTRMPDILKGLTRGLDWKTLDEGLGEQNGIPVSYYPVTECLGVVLPSNSPGVNSIWMPAVALKVPVVLKPGREDPWTPYRIIQAFIAAGVPPGAFSFYPTDHEGANAILASSGRALLFGDEATVERHATNPAVQVHGPGRSKIVIGEDLIERWPEFLEVMVESVTANGGRSCINASAIVVPARARELAEALARRLAILQPLSATEDRAILAGFAKEAVAVAIDTTIDEGLETEGAEDVTARYRKGPRKAVLEDSSYLLPTVVLCDSMSHPLANREFLFPYVSVVEVPPEHVLERIGPSLVVTAITEDRDFTRQLLESPMIDRLNLGPLPTNRVRWDQPHEGNLFEFLYKRRAVQREHYHSP
ncbi:MAG: aldehyde dehydrogenase [Armatimonadetes bacterium]|nr:aldehyde dehydrogenase [Armatimonadota bacterium]